MPALIRLFVDIEHTGGDSQFYDKFNVRHTIAVLIKHLSSHDRHVLQMESLARYVSHITSSGISLDRLKTM